MNDERNIYMIPGLGFDQRIFRNLKLPLDNVHFLDWEKPRYKEHLEDYAFRFSKKIKEGSIVIGHSFGGILAQEIANIRPIEKVILISSIRSRNELPVFFRMVDWLELHPLFTKKTTFSTFKYWAKDHAYDTPEKQSLFKKMVGNQSDQYLKWALKNLSSWKGIENLQTPVIQIHGDCDRTFPIKHLSKPDYTIKSGTHMMVFDQSDEISQIISTEINA